MSAPHHQSDQSGGTSHRDVRVTTMISGAGVRPLSPGGRDSTPANENRWIDRAGIRRRLYANLASTALALLLLYAGVWIVTEFVRLQRLEACFEAGRRDCMPLDMTRRGK